MLLFLSFVENNVNRVTSVSSSARGLPKCRKRRATAELKENQMCVFSNVNYRSGYGSVQAEPEIFFHDPSTIVKQVQDYLTVTIRKTKLKINVTISLALTVIFKHCQM